MHIPSATFRNRWIAVAALLALGATSDVAAAGESEHAHAPAHEHAGHGDSRASPYMRKIANYSPPDVILRSSQDHDVALSELLAEDRPVLMQFIFTSCATICPLLTATFSKAQSEIADAHDHYRMISISIDPEYDTPQRLAAYAARNKAAGNWIFLTGSRGDIRKVMRSFDVLYQGDNKMYHQPYTFLRAGAGEPWVRLEGFLSADELVTEFRSAPGASHVTSP